MNAKALGPAEVRRAGMDALSRALGPVGMARFLQQFESGSGNYSVTRYDTLGDASLEDLVEEIRRRRPSKGESSAEI